MYVMGVMFVDNFANLSRNLIFLMCTFVLKNDRFIRYKDSQDIHFIKVYEFEQRRVLSELKITYFNTEKQ